MKIKITLTIIFFATIILLFYFKNYFLIDSSKPSTQERPNTSVEAIKKIIEELERLQDYSGKPVSVKEVGSLLRAKDQIRVFHFWASWCDPCLNELPDFIRFSQSEFLKNTNTQFFVISLDDDPNGLTKFTKIFPALLDKEFIQIWDEKKILTNIFAIDKLPMTIMTFPNNELRVFNGIVKWSEIKLTPFNNVKSL